MTTTNQRSTSEVGHAKNVANFQTLIEFCNTFNGYNPVNELLTLTKLEEKHTESNDILQKVHAAKAEHIIAINQRQETFQTLSSLSTKIINALSSITNDSRIIADARTIVRKIQGSPSKPQTDPSQEGQETQRPTSNSQRSFDKRTDHFSALVILLKALPDYAPNEPELSISSLDDYLKELQRHNKNVLMKYTPYSSYLLARNKILYDPLDGLTTIAKLVKQYVKSLYGAKSPQYDQIDAIEFKKYS